MNKRSGKFYRKNEADVMRSLGLKPTKNSGSGWIEKEDGQSEDIICQLKSTDAKSIRIAKEDIDTLIYNGLVVHKIPVFAIQFLETNEVFIMMRPEDISEVAKSLKGERIEKTHNEFLGIEDRPDRPLKEEPKRMIKSGGSARKVLEKEREEKYKKKVRSAT
jgi:hypothetical protein